MQQNFRGLHAMLLSARTEPSEATQMLPGALNRLGMDMSSWTTASSMPTLQPQRDVLFLDSDDDLQTLLAPLPPGQLAGLPIIGLVGIEAPGRLRGLMQAGASAFLRKPVCGSSVYAALFLSVNAHRARLHTEALLAEHEERRRGRRYLIRATIRMMQQNGVDDEEAYNLLRRAAMRARMSIEDYSRSWLAEPTSADTPQRSKRIA